MQGYLKLYLCIMIFKSRIEVKAQVRVAVGAYLSLFLWLVVSRFNATLKFLFLDSVLRFAGEWNTNSRHCHEAQFVLNTVLKTYPPEEILKFPNIKSTMEAFIPYTGAMSSCELPCMIL